MSTMNEVHMRLDIRGALRSKSFRGFTHPDGTPMRRVEVADHLKMLLAKGHQFLPVGNCPHFDVKSGCRCAEFNPENPVNPVKT